MPIYEYRCDACGHELETIQKISDDLLVDCPACEKPSLRKKISAAGFRLKGGGWYETDFKSGNKKNVSGGGDGGGDGSSGGGESSSSSSDASSSSSESKSDSSGASSSAKSDAKAKPSSSSSSD